MADWLRSLAVVVFVGFMHRSMVPRQLPLSEALTTFSGSWFISAPLLVLWLFMIFFCLLSCRFTISEGGYMYVYLPVGFSEKPHFFLWEQVFICGNYLRFECYSVTEGNYIGMTMGHSRFYGKWIFISESPPCVLAEFNISIVSACMYVCVYFLQRSLQNCQNSVEYR